MNRNSLHKLGLKIHKSCHAIWFCRYIVGHSMFTSYSSDHNLVIVYRHDVVIIRDDVKGLKI